MKGKVARIEEDPETKDLMIEVEDIAAGKKIREQVEMAVLAVGIVPITADTKIPAEITYDDYGFIASTPPGIHAAGCSRRPADVATSVQDATGAALKAIQSIVRERANG